MKRLLTFLGYWSVVFLFLAFVFTVAYFLWCAAFEMVDGDRAEVSREYL
jgi:hypothetical protein